MRLIDADALIDEAMDRYCKECDKRKGIKSGKWRIVYEIGEAPCRACDVDDMIDDLENAPTVSPDMAQVLAYECGKAERKCGRWIEEPNCTYRCSQCGEHYQSIRGYMYHNFCPNCGADMRGENNGNNVRE